MHIILENINQFHQHIDFIYYAEANTSELNPAEGEVKDLRWLTEDEIKALGKIPANVKKTSLEALRIFSGMGQFYNYMCSETNALGVKKIIC